MEGTFFKRILAKLYCIKCKEIKTFFEMYNSMFHIQDHTNDFGYIKGYTSKLLEMYFQLCYMVFNTFQQSSKIMHSVCLSVHALTVVNIFPMSLNLYMGFRFKIE